MATPGRLPSREPNSPGKQSLGTRKSSKAMRFKESVMNSPYMNEVQLSRKQRKQALNKSGNKSLTCDPNAFWVYKRTRSHSEMKKLDETTHLMRLGIISPVSHRQRRKPQSDPYCCTTPLSPGGALPLQMGLTSPSRPMEASTMGAEAPVNVEVVCLDAQGQANTDGVIGRLLVMRETSLLDVRRLLLRFGSHKLKSYVFLDSWDSEQRSVPMHREEKLKVAEIGQVAPPLNTEEHPQEKSEGADSGSGAGGVEGSSSGEEKCGISISTTANSRTSNGGLSTVRLLVREKKVHSEMLRIISKNMSKRNGRESDPKVLSWTSEQEKDAELNLKLGLKLEDYDVDERAKAPKRHSPLPHWLDLSDEDIEGIISVLGLPVTTGALDMFHPQSMNSDDLFELVSVHAQQAGASRVAFSKLYNILNWLRRVWADIFHSRPKNTTYQQDISEEEVRRVVSFIDKTGEGIDLAELERSFAMVSHNMSNVILSQGATAAISTLHAYMHHRHWGAEDLLAHLQNEGEEHVVRTEDLRCLLEEIFLEETTPIAETSGSPFGTGGFGGLPEVGASEEPCILDARSAAPVDPTAQQQRQEGGGSGEAGKAQPSRALPDVAPAAAAPPPLSPSPSRRNHAAKLSRRRKRAAVDLVCSHFDPNGDGVIQTHEFLRAFRVGEKSIQHHSIEAQKLRAAEAQNEALAQLGTPNRLTEEDIRMLLRWIQGEQGGEPGAAAGGRDSSSSSSTTSGTTGTLTLAELERAFRGARRAAAEHKLDVQGRDLMLRLRAWMDRKRLTVKMWFDMMDAGGGDVDGGPGVTDGRITMRELKTGLRRLVQLHQRKVDPRQPDIFSEEELYKLLRYINRSGTGEISLEEVREVFRRLDQGGRTAAENLDAQIGPVLVRVEEALRGMRLKDFFVQLDRKNEKHISTADFKRGLERLLLPSGTLRARAKRRAAEVQRLSREYTQQLDKAISAADQVHKLERTGVAEVLRRLDHHMKNRGLKIVDLFNEIDTSRDGRLDADEVAVMLKKVSLPSFEARAAMKRQEIRLNQRKAAEEERRKLHADMMARMARAEECGASLVLERIDAYMRQWQMRLSDLFRLVDTSGDGNVDNAELGTLLVKLQIAATPLQVQKLFDYIDTSGDGLISNDELEAAIRQFRRYRWEKAMISRYSDQGRLPLFLKYSSFDEIFAPTDGVLGWLNASDVRLGLRRLRGDVDVVFQDAEAVRHLSEEERITAMQALQKLATYLHEYGLSAEAHMVQSGVPLEDRRVFVDDLQVWIAQIQEATGQTELEKKTHKFEKTMVEQVKTAVSREEIEQVIRLLDKDGDDEIDPLELQSSFHMIKPANSQALIHSGACAAMGILYQCLPESVSGSRKGRSRKGRGGGAGLVPFANLFAQAPGMDRTLPSDQFCAGVLANIQNRPTEADGSVKGPAASTAVLDQCLTVLKFFLDPDATGLIHQSKVAMVFGHTAERRVHDNLLKRITGLRKERRSLEMLLAERDEEMTQEELDELVEVLLPGISDIARRGREVQIEPRVLEEALTRVRRETTERKRTREGLIALREIQQALDTVRWVPVPPPPEKFPRVSKRSTRMGAGQQEPGVVTSGNVEQGAGENQAAALALKREHLDIFPAHVPGDDLEYVIRGDGVRVHVSDLVDSLPADVWLRSLPVTHWPTSGRMDATLANPASTLTQTAAGRARRRVALWDLKKAIVHLQETARMRLWNDQELSDLARFLDPAGEGNPSSDVILTRFQQLSSADKDRLFGGEEDSKSSDEEESIGEADRLARLGGRMEKVLQGRRVIDLLREIDPQYTYSISLTKLRQGLERIFRPSQFLRDRIRSKCNEIAMLEHEYTSCERKAIEAASILVGLEKSGAAPVLRKLDRRIQERGLRIFDLFLEMDKDRDGKLSGDELRAALDKLLEPPADVKASMKLREEQQIRRERFIQEKEYETQKIHAKMEEAERSGASVLIKALEGRMRELMCRTVDLFRAIDTTGDGECDLDELCAIMDFVDLDVTRDQVETTMAFLDRGNANGTIDADELETAVRHYRRARWEKRIVAMAQKAARVAMLDKGVLDRREAKTLVQYLTCGFQIKNVPIDFLQRALVANRDRKLALAVHQPELEHRFERMKQISFLSNDTEASSMEELWPVSPGFAADPDRVFPLA